MNPLIAIAAQIFPEILKVVAGDQGGSIAQQVVQAVQDITGAKTADEARQKVAADPKVAADLQVKLAEIALNSQIVVAQQQLQEDAIAASSTSDARKNLAILAALDKPLSWTPSIISYIVIAGFFLIVFLLMFGVLKPAASTTDTGQVTVIQIVNICIGAIATAFATVIQFWLGSSLGSKNKDDALIQAQKVAQAGTLVSTPATSQGDGTSDGGDDGSTSKPTKPGPDGGPSEKGTGTSAGQGGPNKSTSLPTPAIDRFPDCVALTLAWEGGNDDDPRDRGGRTSRGITQDDWDEWRQSHAGLPSDVWSAPQDQIVAIYRQKYWNAMSCGQLPAGLDYCVFDYGVNSGIGRAAKVLQQFVGTTVDGEIGPLTIAAAAQADAALLVNKICDQRLAFLKGVGSWATFGVGWTRRVEGVRKQAAAMIGKPAVSGAPLPSLPAADPLWLVKARTFKGFAWPSGGPPQQIETWLNLIRANSQNNQDLAQYCNRLATGGYFPWCGVFVAAMLAEAGLPPVFAGPNDTDRFAWAPAWDSYGTKVDIENGELPQPGDIMRFNWHGGGEHVTFYDHPVDSDDMYHCCGGNQGGGHVVSIEGMPMNCIVAVRRPVMEIA